jgi:integrase
LLRLCWETGARIGDIVDVKVGDVDFKEKILKLRVKKRKNVNHIPLGDDILLEMSNFIRLQHMVIFFDESIYRLSLRDSIPLSI